MRKSEKEVAVEIVRRLAKNGFEAYFVGGCVRDMLMGKEPFDHDIATSARPEDVTRLFSHVVPVGAQFGVMIVIEEGHAFQVATFRADMEYLDGRKPSGVTFSSAREDVLRRDFTVNGLLYDPQENQLLDFVGGEQDIRAGVIRTIGDPTKRFTEDKLRLLRAVRFSSTLGFRIEEQTLTAIRHRAGEIGVVSQERIRDELVKMLIGPRAGMGLELLYETRLLKMVLPEVHAMKGVLQPQGCHPEGDVFAHTRQMLDGMHEPSVVLAFSVLLHDVGKPRTLTVEDRIRFFRHQTVGAEIAREICNRLRFPNHLRDRIAACVENHMVFMEVKRMRESTIKRLVARPTFFDELELHRLDCLASDHDISAWEFLKKKVEEYGREDIKPKPLLTGKDLLQLGFLEGPIIGDILAEVEEMQLENRLKTKEEAQEWVRKNYPSETLNPESRTNSKH
ncbi:MAG: CCA tRNA nucleotidyltransferase [Candidatus Aureabacteria bacterium]|nr:CCA tRNA nucleotidyltransferase [Candidatus Auribacterota bacterium]